MFRFLRSRRSAPKRRPDPPEWPINTIGGLSNFLGERLGRVQHLIQARRGASVSELATIDEEIDQICRNMAEDIEKGEIGSDKLSQRLQRMMRITLEEICEQRDKARQLRQPVTGPDRKPR
jgi:hypothetical protein